MLDDGYGQIRSGDQCGANNALFDFPVILIYHRFGQPRFLACYPRLRGESILLHRHAAGTGGANVGSV
jgi:hypothetical protein